MLIKSIHVLSACYESDYMLNCRDRDEKLSLCSFGADRFIEIDNVAYRNHSFTKGPLPFLKETPLHPEPHSLCVLYHSTSHDFWFLFSQSVELLHLCYTHFESFSRIAWDAA